MGYVCSKQNLSTYGEPCGFITFFYITLATHVTAHDVCVIQEAEVYNQAALIVPISINGNEKHSYLQQNISPLENDYITFLKKVM